METSRYLPSSLSGEEVLRRVEVRWIIDGHFPLPRWRVLCPICDTDDVIIRRVRFFEKGNKDATLPWRCDVGFKCRVCSMTWTHGVAIPKRMFDIHNPPRVYTRRDILAFINA